MRIRMTLPLTAVLLGSLVTGAVAQNYSVGQTAPSIELPRFGGGTLNTQDYAGQTLFINFLGSY